jgi:Na+/H+-dicarboxylate symporter
MRIGEVARNLTAWSVAALIGGLIAGTALRGVDGPVQVAFSTVLEGAANIWIDALQMTVLPLVVIQMLVAVTRGSGRIGSLGLRALLLFLGLLVGGAVVSVIVSPPLISLYTIDSATVDAISASVSSTVPEAAGAGPASIASWVRGLVPANVVQAALDGEILPLLVFALLFGLAVRSLPDEQAAPTVGLFGAIADALLRLVRWILVATPVGVFALTYLLALRTGVEAAGLLGAFIVIQCAVMLIYGALLYPVTALASGVPIRRFARAVLPAQLVALSTRSSIASLPALVQGGRDRLGLSDSATGFVLPLSVSVFKVNRTLSAPMKLLFLAWMFGIDLSLAQIATFVATVILLSFAAVGLPGGGSAFKTLPAYLAAGMPIEGVVILEAADTIPDVIKTILNVTGDMSVATILDRPAVDPAAAVPTGIAVPAEV